MIDSEIDCPVGIVNVKYPNGLARLGLIPKWSKYPNGLHSEMIGNSRTWAMDDFARPPNHSTVNWFRNRATRRPSYTACLGYIAVYGDGNSPLINTPVLHTTRCVYDSLIAQANNIYINHDCAVRLKLWDFTQEFDVRVWWCSNNPWDLSWMVVPTRTSVVHIEWL